MTYAAVSVPDGVWGVDIDTPLTDAMLDALLSTDLHALVPSAPPGSYPMVIVRYVGLQGPARGDISAAELQRILDHPKRPILLLVQHVEAGMWVAYAVSGIVHADAAVADAKAAGYDAAGLSLIVDMESLNASISGLSYAQNWLNVTSGDGFGKALYEGFDAGLTGQQLLDLLCPLWSDAGPRVLPGGATFAAKQTRTIKIGGTEYDANRFQIDSRGYAFVGLQRVEENLDPPDPHT
jgi:hypothetical protein